MARVGKTRSSSRVRVRFTDFNDQLLSFNGKVKGDFRKFQEDLAYEALRKLRQRTPKKSGRAVANWSIYGLESKKLGRKLAVGNVAWRGSGPYPRGRTRGGLASFQLEKAVPYIFRLEHGDSGQAPKGMVRVTAAELRNRFWGKK